jgi:hypothetical protein
MTSLPLKALLTGIVDYAGLFPPATLSLPEAMETYVQASLACDRWMLGKFVLPVSRWIDFEALLSKFSLPQWCLSLILSGEPNAGLEQLQSCHREAIAVSAVEFAPLPVSEIVAILPRLPAGVDAFFEIPLEADLSAYLSVLQGSDAFAKVRTGGITADAFPSTEHLAQFILACAHAHVPFKATAGLHHPIRGNYCLTYEPNSPSTVMHGFLNVAIAAALTYWKNVNLEEVIAVLQISSRDQFQFHADGIEWGGHALAIAELEQSRQQFFRSFGSCSFQEPVNDLNDLHINN